MAQPYFATNRTSCMVLITKERLTATTFIGTPRRGFPWISDYINCVQQALRQSYLALYMWKSVRPSEWKAKDQQTSPYFIHFPSRTARTSVVWVSGLTDATPRITGALSVLIRLSCVVALRGINANRKLSKIPNRLNVVDMLIQLEVGEIILSRKLR